MSFKIHQCLYCAVLQNPVNVIYLDCESSQHVAVLLGDTAYVDRDIPVDATLIWYVCLTLGLSNSNNGYLL